MNSFIEAWKKDMIEFSKHNRLLNFQTGSDSELLIINPRPSELLDILVARNEMEISRQTLESIDKAVARGQLKAVGATKKSLVFLNKNGSAFDAIDSIIEKNNELILQYGEAATYLAIGTLEWGQAEGDRIISPLLLFPVKFLEKGDGSYVLASKDLDLIVNPLLQIRLFDDYKYLVPEPDLTEKKFSLSKFIDKIKKSISQVQHKGRPWLINDNVMFLTVFPIPGCSAYKDLLLNEKEISNVDVMRRLLKLKPIEEKKDEKTGAKQRMFVSSAPRMTSVEFNDSIFEKLYPMEFATPAQLSTMYALSKGHSFSIETPYGCAKAAGIANLISQAIIEKKNVLFASKESSSIQNVYKSFQNYGLDDYVFNFSGVRKNRIQFMNYVKLILKSLETMDLPTSVNLDDINKQLADHVEVFNKYALLLHTNDPQHGVSPAKILMRLMELNRVPVVSSSVINNFASRKYQDVVEIVNVLKSYDEVSKEIKNISKTGNNPWIATSGDSVISSSQIPNMLSCLTGIIKECEFYIIYAKNIASQGINVTSKKEIIDLCSVVDLIKGSPIHHSLIFDTEKRDSAVEDLNKLYTLEQRKTQNDNRIAQVFTKEIYGSRVGEWYKVIKDYKRASEGESEFAPDTAHFKAVWAQIESRVNSKKYIETIDGILAEIKNVLDTAEIKQEIFNIREHLVQAGLRKGFDSAETIRQIETFRRLDPFIKAISSIYSEGDTPQQFKEKIDNLRSKFPGNVDPLSEKRLAFLQEYIPATNEFATKNLAEVRTTVIKLREILVESARGPFAAMLRIKENLGELGVIDFVNAQKIDNPHYATSELFEKGVYSAWASSLTSDPALSSLNSQPTSKNTYNHLKILMNSYYENVHTLLRNTIISNKPKLNVHVKLVELQELKKMVKDVEYANKIGIIKSLKTYGHIFQKAFPIMMMNLQDVATYLPAKMKFDLVIIDQGNTTFPLVSLPALYRSKQVVILGDSHLLAPKNDTVASAMWHKLPKTVDQKASILQLFKENYPMYTFNYLYNTKSELISNFVNKTIYECECITYPQIAKEDEDGLGIDIYEVDGASWDDEKKCNPVEAKGVIDVIKSHVLNHPERSLGVIAFEEEQAKCIDDLLMQSLGEDSKLLSFIVDMHKENPFFIRTAKTAEAFTRDTIILSTGYGSSVPGKVASTFGDISLPGGEKLVCSAVTRASQNLIVVTSQKASSWGTESMTSGPAMLRLLIQYATFGDRVLSNDYYTKKGLLKRFPHNNLVKDCVYSKGYEAQTCYGLGPHQIDLIVHHTGTNKPFMAVEFDGGVYSLEKTVYAREYARQHILERLGWMYLRQYLPEWYLHNEYVDGLLTNNIMINEKLYEKAIKRRELIDGNPEYPFFSVYIKAILDNTLPIERQCQIVLNTEAPINEEWMFMRFYQDWFPNADVMRAKRIFEELLNDVIKKDNSFVRRGGFVYNKNKKILFRLPEDDEARALANIPIEELENGFDMLIKNKYASTPKGKLTYNQLASELMQVLQLPASEDKSKQMRLHQAWSSYIRKGN